MSCGIERAELILRCALARAFLFPPFTALGRDLSAFLFRGKRNFRENATLAALFTPERLLYYRPHGNRRARVLSEWFIHRAIRADSRRRVILSCKVIPVQIAKGWWAGGMGRGTCRAPALFPFDLSRFIPHWTELAVHANCYSYRYRSFYYSPRRQLWARNGPTLKTTVIASHRFLSFFLFSFVRPPTMNKVKRMSLHR